MSDSKPIVIDIGSGRIKAGFSGDSIPKINFPSVIGKLKKNFTGDKETFIGEEALLKSEKLTLKYPIERGIITDWNEMEELWHHTFYNELTISPEDQAVFLTESIAKNPRPCREKMTEIMFETFNVPAMHVANQSSLSLFASGRTTGIVLDSGHGVTQSVSIYEGFTLPQSIIRLDFGGRDLSEYLRRLLLERDYSFEPYFDLETVRDMKETLCFISPGFDNKNSKEIEKIYKLPDGNIVTLGNERFKCTEALFNPMLLGIESQGIQESIYQSIQKCDICIRKEFYFNIVLSGGTTMFQGMEDRIHKEALNLVPDSMNVKVIAPPERMYYSWLGGSLLSSLSTFQESWISKDEYDETGPAIIHNKCFY
jgi:actin-related protein